MTRIPSNERPFSPWPCAIGTFFAVFIAFLAAFITWAIRQKIDLVNEDYYTDEILYQKQIDTAARTAPFESQIELDYDVARRAIRIRLPAEHASARPSGRICLYRPSDARQDLELPLAPDRDGAQCVDASRLQPGLWQVRMEWKAGVENFSFAKKIIVGG